MAAEHAYADLCNACADRRLDVELVAGDVRFALSTVDKCFWRRVTRVRISSAGTVIAFEACAGLQDLERASTELLERLPARH